MTIGKFIFTAVSRKAISNAQFEAFDRWLHRSSLDSKKRAAA
jgi:hypothetical protein